VPNSLSYSENVGAASAIVSQHIEEVLTRRVGVKWVARDEGRGLEIKDVSGSWCGCSPRAASPSPPTGVLASHCHQLYLM